MNVYGEYKGPMIKFTIENAVHLLMNLFVFIVCIYPEYLTRFFWFTGYYNYYRLVAWGIMGLYIYLMLDFDHINILPSLIIVLYFVALNAVNYIHSGGIDIGLLITYTLFFAFFDVQFQNNWERTVICIAIILSIYILINAITVLVFRNGLYLSPHTHNPSYFLGHRNSIVKFAIPQTVFVVIALYRVEYKYRRILSGFFLLLNLFIARRTWTGSGMLSIVIFAFVLFVVCIWDFRFINMKNIVLVILLAFVCFTIFRIQDLFQVLIVNILHKDLSLTGRTLLWDLAIEKIKLHPIIGNGAFNATKLGEKFIVSNSSHSLYLDILFRGGIILFSAYLIPILYLGNSLDNDFRDLVAKGALMGGITAFLFLGLGEPISGNVECFIYLMLQTGYWGREIVKNEKRDNTKLYI